jgi:DNA-binding CsgD family transcriptional regulator
MKQLTPREKEVLELVSNGETSITIAKLLSISARTVEHHVSNARKKLGAKNIQHAVRIGIERGDITGSITLAVIPLQETSTVWCNLMLHNSIVVMMSRHGFLPDGYGGLYRKETGCRFDKELILEHDSLQSFTNEWGYA